MRGLIYANDVGNWHGYWFQFKVILQAATRGSLEVVIGVTQPSLLHCWWHSASTAEQTLGGGCRCSVIRAHARCRCQSEPAGSWDGFVSHNILWVQAHISARVTLLRGYLEQPGFHSCKEPFSSAAFPSHTWRSECHLGIQAAFWLISVSSAMLKMPCHYNSNKLCF